MVSCGLNTPPNGPLPCHYLEVSLSSPWHWTDAPSNKSHLSQDNYVSTLLTIFLYRSAASRQKNGFQCPDVLPQPEAPAIPDFLCSNGEPRWESGPAARRWRLRVKAVGAMGDRSGKVKWHTRRKQKDEKGRTEKLRIGCYRTYGRYFSVAPSGFGRRRPRGVSVSGIVGSVAWGRRPLACLYSRFFL